MCKSIEKDRLTGNIKYIYSTLKSISRTSQQNVTVAEREISKLMTGNDEVLHRLTQYWNGL